MKFKNCLAGHLCKTSLSRKEAESVVDEAMAKYLKRCNPDGFSDRLMNSARNILNRLPDSLSEQIRALHIEFQFKRSANDVSLANNEDFKKIKSCVMSHH